jgi:hypothetical protein
MQKQRENRVVAYLINLIKSISLMNSTKLIKLSNPLDLVCDTQYSLFSTYLNKTKGTSTIRLCKVIKLLFLVLPFGISILYWKHNKILLRLQEE